MKLSEVLACLDEWGAGPAPVKDPVIKGIKMDSREVKKGDLFFAISGHVSDGHHYIEDAIKRGAAAIVGEKTMQIPIPYIRVSDSRHALGRIASSYYGFPSKKHKIIGITGTNGKTTISYILKHILETAGFSCSLLGTVSYMINNKNYQPINTTPDSLTLQKLLAQSRDEFVLLEVSSHGLEQLRVEGLELDYALFINLSHEHLDYHKNMDQYFSIKRKIFNYLKKDGKGAVNQLDPWGKKLASLLANTDIPILSLGGKGYNDVGINHIILNGRTHFSLNYKGGRHGISFPFPGEHNVYNAAMAFLVAADIGIKIETVIRALGTFPGVPGRFEMVPHPNGATFIIDYAHTKDAFEYCLKAARQHDARRVVHIFGFRGNRDHTKRKTMIETSAAMTDRFILTLDDLNGVKEEEMIAELRYLNSFYGEGKGKVIADRTLAIKTAWNEAQEGDWVLITGKGPESYQKEFAIPATNDMETLRYLLDKKNMEKVM